MITPERLGILSGVLQIASFWTQIRPVAWPRPGRPRQQPHKVSFLGWMALYQVMFWASVFRGATGSLWIVGAEVIGCTTMFGLSLKWGTGSLRLIRRTRAAPWVKVTSWPDFLVLCGTAAGLACWLIFSSATLGIILTVAVDTLSALPLIGLLLHKPRTVSLPGWTISGLASLTAIFSVSAGQALVLYLYPVAGLALDAVIVAAILAGYRAAGRRGRHVAGLAPAAARDQAGSITG